MPSLVENASIQWVEAVTGTLSFFASAYMLIRLQLEASHTLYRGETANLFNTLLRVLFFIEIILSIFYAIGRSGQSNDGLCQFQGFMIQWFSVAVFLWVVLLSYYLYYWVVRRRHPKRLEKSFRPKLVMIFFVSGSLALILLLAGVYDGSYLWCWIDEGYFEARIVCFELFLFGSWIISCTVFWQVSYTIDERLKRNTIQTNITLISTNTLRLQRKLMLYIGSFIIVWFFALLNRIVEYANGGVLYPTALLAALFLPTQGLINALIYGNLLNCMGQDFDEKADMTSAVQGRNTSVEVDILREVQSSLTPPFNVRSPNYVPKQYSVFITTFNLGEAPLESLAPDVKDWIVSGHDIYAIGLQECVDLQNIRELIHNHLGGPSAYTMYKAAIGSGQTQLGYHGFIALTVFVRASEIEAGNIVATEPSSDAAATGTDLIIATAQNKGAVGIPLQIYDTCIGFVTCHLPSDSKGKSKLRKRNASAHAILKDVILATEDQGFDLHLQHDHVFVFGDLNYRMDTTQNGDGVNSLTGVAIACSIEKSTLNEDPLWLERKYNLLRHKSDVLYPTIDELKLIKAAMKSSRGAWTSVLRADELRAIIDDGDAFCGFEEPMPCFPPSYKRKKGHHEGNCGDYTDFSAILKGFSNTGLVENILETTGGKPLVSTGADTMISNAISHVGMRLLKLDLSSKSQGEGDDTAEKKERDDNSISISVSKQSDTTQALDHADNDGKSHRRAALIADEPLANNVISNKDIDPSKKRPPSYTDRILIHSLPDRVNRLTVQAYDLCDTVRISDHRAVSMTVLLEVNAAVVYGTALEKQAIAASKPPAFELYEVEVSDVSIALYDLVTEEEDEDENELEDVYRDTEAQTPALPSLSSVQINPLRSVANDSSARGRLLGRYNSYRSNTDIEAPPLKETRAKTEAASNEMENGIELQAASSASSIATTESTGVEPVISADAAGRAIAKRESKQPTGRRRSLFARLFSSTQESPLPPVEEADSDAILKEISEDSMSWRKDLNLPNTWRKKVQEEERRDREKAVNPASQLRKKIKKSRDKNLHHITMVFPLPSKDPLLQHRKVFDIIQVIDLSSKSRSIKKQMAVDVENKGSSRHEEDLLKPSSTFAWHNDPQSPRVVHHDESVSNRSKTIFQTEDVFRIKGCASLELGAHLLLKVCNRDGYEFGSCVICLSHLLHTDRHSVHSSRLTELTLSSGGQKRGKLTAKFSLRYLPSPLSPLHEANRKEHGNA